MRRSGKTKLLAVIVLAFMIVNGTHSQNPVKQLRFLKPDKKSVTVRFTFINNLIILPVTVNGSDTMNFILDTGLTTSIITELGYLDSVQLNYAQTMELHGLGSGEALSALHSFGNTIQIRGIQGENQDFYVLLENVFHLSSKLGMQINGILGYSVFENFIVSVNYDHRTITFSDPDYFSYAKAERKYTSIPIILHDTKPYINMTITDSTGKAFDVKMLLDTGASHALWLNPASLPEMVIPQQQQYTYLGSGLNGDIHGVVTRMKSIEVGGFDLDNVIVSFPDSVSIAHAIALDKRNGSIGSEILKRFNFIIDYPNHRLSIKKNSNYKNAFTENLSGMEVIAPIPELHTYLVEEVREGSPADKAGLRKGDVLEYIGGVPVKKLTLNEIYQILQSRPGRRISIEYRRQESHKKTKLTLENFI